VETRLNRSHKAVEALSHRLLQQHPKLRLELAQQKLQADATRLRRATGQNLQIHRGALEYLTKRLENSSLNATLDRGYAILQAEDGRILPDKKAAAGEKSIRARLRDGEIQLRNET
jgi:exodeoxyribonuclease VII large subunit